MMRKSRSIENAKLIDEKVLRRYVYEKLVFGKHSERSLLMPDRLRRKRLKVVVPEFPLLSPKKRTDFRLIFNDSTWQNVEVEWATSTFKDHGEEDARSNYAGGKGYLIVTEDDHETATRWIKDLVEDGQLKVMTVDHSDFTYWFVKNSKFFLEGTIAQYSPEYQRRDKRYWVIYISKSGGSEQDYFYKGRSKGVWAFRYSKGETAKSILSITTGDVVIFAARWTVPGGRMIYPGKARNWTCKHIDIFDVSVGYYCDFEDETFEDAGFKETRKPENKEYMHYFRFFPRVRSEHNRDGERQPVWIEGKDFDPIREEDQEICAAFRTSNARRGGPVELSEQAFQVLLAMIEEKMRARATI